MVLSRREYGDQFVYERSRAMQLRRNRMKRFSPRRRCWHPHRRCSEHAPVEAVSPSGDTVETATVVDTPPLLLPLLWPHRDPRLRKPSQDCKQPALMDWPVWRCLAAELSCSASRSCTHKPMGCATPTFTMNSRTRERVRIALRAALVTRRDTSTASSTLSDSKCILGMDR